MLLSYMRSMKTLITCTLSKSKILNKVNNLNRVCNGGELFDRIVAEGHFSE